MTILIKSVCKHMTSSSHWGVTCSKSCLSSSLSTGTVSRISCICSSSWAPGREGINQSDTSREETSIGYISRRKCDQLESNRITWWCELSSEINDKVRVFNKKSEDRMEYAAVSLIWFDLKSMNRNHHSKSQIFRQKKSDSVKLNFCPWMWCSQTCSMLKLCR